MQRQHCLQVTCGHNSINYGPHAATTAQSAGHLRPTSQPTHTSNRPPAATQQSHQPPMHMQVCQRCLWATCGHYSAVYQPPTANQAIQHSLRAIYGHSSSYQHVPRSSPATCSNTAQCISHLRPHSTTQHRFGNTTATGVHAGLAALSTGHLRPPSSVYCMLPATVSHSAKPC